MANANKYFTLNNISDIIEIVEEFLEDYNVRIPESDEENKENNGNENMDVRIYGTVYFDLEDRLLGYFEDLAKKGTIPKVVNSSDDEVETWKEE